MLSRLVITFYMIVLFIISWGIFILFSIVTVPVYLPTKTVSVFLSPPYPHQHLSFCLMCISLMQWCWSVVLSTCPYDCWLFDFLLSKNICCKISFAFYFIGLFMFLQLSCMNSLYMLDINSLSDMKFTNIFSYFIEFLFIVFPLLCKSFLLWCSSTCLFLLYFFGGGFPFLY